MLNGYVWDMCGVRYANNILKNPATKRLSGKKKRGQARETFCKHFVSFCYVVRCDVVLLHYYVMRCYLAAVSCGTICVYRSCPSRAGQAGGGSFKKKI